MNITPQTAIVIAAQLLYSGASFSQEPPSAAAVSLKTPTQVAYAGGAQVQGKIKEIHKGDRVVVVSGFDGQELAFHCGEDVLNFENIAIGDIVTVNHVRAVALELRKTSNNGIRESAESVHSERANLGEKPAILVRYKIHVVANVVDMNAAKGSATIKGPRRQVELAIQDKQRLEGVKIGDTVEAEFLEEYLVAVTKGM